MLMPPASVSQRSQRSSLECTTFLRTLDYSGETPPPLAARWMSAPTLYKCVHLYLITASLFPFDLSQYFFSHFCSLFTSFQSRHYNFYICNWIQRGQKVHLTLQLNWRFLVSGLTFLQYIPLISITQYLKPKSATEFDGHAYVNIAYVKKCKISPSNHS